MRGQTEGNDGKDPPGDEDGREEGKMGRKYSDKERVGVMGLRVCQTVCGNGRSGEINGSVPLLEEIKKHLQ